MTPINPLKPGDSRLRYFVSLLVVLLHWLLRRPLKVFVFQKTIRLRPTVNGICYFIRWFFTREDCNLM